MMRRGTLLMPLALLAACAGNIDEGQQISEIAASEEQPAPSDLPVERSEPVRRSAELALQNYEKLLDLPQDPATRAETMRRLADLQLEIDEAGGSDSLQQSEQRLRRSISLYNAVLADRPDAPTNDRVLYQLARAYQNVGEFDKAETVLLRMTREYPQSSYADDAHFRRAELLFRLKQFDDASAEYRHVLALKDSTPFFEAAQYKYGWSEYRQSNYETALLVFLTILNRELPPGEQTDLDAALAGVAAGKKDMTRDALRVVSLSFTQLGGAEAAKRYFAANGEPAYSVLVYAALGEHLLEKKRYTDSARAYEVFVESHPRHPLAPDFLARAIAAQEKGGFIEPVVAAKERYARHLDPAAPYWAGGTASPEVLQSLRGHLEDLARYYQARGQKPREAGTPPPAADFQAAARWYRRLLEVYPQDPKAPELRFLLAEALYEGGDPVAAAQEYDRVVADHASYEKAPDAAYAALLARQRHAQNAPEAQRPAALRQSVDAALRLAQGYPQHPQALPALTRAAEELYLLGAFDEAAQVATRVLRAAPPAPEALRRTAWGVAADAHFSQKRYAEAESAYTNLLRLVPADAPERAQLTERLASAIYKQGEAAREAGDARAAADHFLRVGRLAPAAAIRGTAEYDASAMLIQLKDWTAAATVLEAFRTAYPASPLLPEVDKKLAVAYTEAGKPREAATVLGRIASRAGETPDSRRDAAWLAATLLDQAGDARAAAAYEDYVRQYPQPFEPAMEARQKLADAAAARKDSERRRHWLREIVVADRNAGAARSPRSRQLAAEASLQLALEEVQKAARLPLKLPLKQSLPPKKAAMERAIAALSDAAAYGVAGVTTAATYELGTLYQGLSKALLQSDRPRNLSKLEREQYDLLLEEQAFPFEEKAIQWHEANLQRVAQGVYTEWIGRSLEALAQMVPGRYARREQADDAHDAALPGPATAPARARPATKAGAAAAPDARSLPERYAEAQRFLKLNQYPAAQPALLEAARAFPRFSGVHTNLGILYARTGRKAEAQAAFGRAVAADPANAVAHNWLGVLAREAGNLPRAEQAYRQALAADPSSAAAQFNLAILYDEHLKRPAEALAAYRRYAELTQNKDLRAAAWSAALEARQPQAPAPTPAAASPATPAPAATPRRTAPEKRTGGTKS